MGKINENQLESQLRVMTNNAIKKGEEFQFLNALYFPHKEVKTSDKGYKEFVNKHFDYYNQLKQEYESQEKAKFKALYNTAKYIFQNHEKELNQE